MGRRGLSENYLWGGLFTLAFILGFLFLDLRPPHHDEGINGWFVDQLITRGYYPYDPTNYHGPLHFYILWFFKFFFGRNLWALRAPSVLFQLGSIFVLYKMSPFVGRKTSLVASLLLTLSPAFLFFTRNAIHESEFIFFNILSVFGLLGLYFEGTRKFLWILFAGLTGLLLTKETYVAHIPSLFLAYFALKIWEKLIPSRNPILKSMTKQKWSREDFYIALGSSLFVLVIFYSGFFLNWKGLQDFASALIPWFKTGFTKHTGHEKPWYYWLSLMKKYEPYALVAIVLSFYFFIRGDRLSRYLSFYALGILTAYSIASYKTPWCVVSILWPFTLIIGRAFEVLPIKVTVKKLALAALVIFLSYKSYFLNYIHYTDIQEPYVYVHTFNDIKKMTLPLFTEVKNDPAAYNRKGIFVLGGTFPLPWVLGAFNDIAYYEKEERPDQYAHADFLIIKNSDIEKVEPLLSGEYYVASGQLRDAQEGVKIYYKKASFLKDYFATHSHEFKDASFGKKGVSSL